MTPLYQQALSLYNQGDYEGAWMLLQDVDLETEQEKKLFKECEKLVTEQATYIIKSYIEEGEFLKAKELRLDFLTKYGYRAPVESIKIPELEQSSQYYSKQTVDEIEQELIPTDQVPPITDEGKKFWEKKLVMITLLFVFILGCVCLFYKNKNGIEIFGSQISDNEIPQEVRTNLNILKSNMQYEIITIDEKKNIAYCLDKDKKYLYVKYNLETGQVEEKKLSSEDFAGIQYLDEAFYLKNSNSIIFMGGNGWNGMGAGMYALKLNLSTDKLNEICFARQVKRVGDYLLAQQMELVVEGDCSASNDYNFYDEYYDYNGNLIDGKTIHKKGYIGKYAIEMSFHVLHKEIRGWYKYEGHTNYMTIQGKIDDDGSFDFLEFSDKMEPFGRFVGQADFEQGTLIGTWNKDGKQLDFFVGK